MPLLSNLLAKKHENSGRTVGHLILVRHGESVWNRDNRFAGWADIDLTHRGIHQMQEVGRQLGQAQLVPDVAYTSRLLRSRVSHDVMVTAMQRGGIPLMVDWRLNERHYGALTGLSKADAIKDYGSVAVQRWRRSFDAMPPPLGMRENLTLLGDAYDDLPIDHKPIGESLAQVVRRVSLCWGQELLPALREGKCVLVTAHGNSLRALVKLIERISDQSIVSLEVANASAIIYQFEGSGRLIRVNCLRPSIDTPSMIL